MAAQVIDLSTRRARRQMPEATASACEPGTVTCFRCGCSTVAMAEPGPTTTCPVCGDPSAQLEPFEKAIEHRPSAKVVALR